VERAAWSGGSHPSPHAAMGPPPAVCSAVAAGRVSESVVSDPADLE
jgi:hypothetical protein